MNYREKHEELTGYQLSRQWFDFAFENPEKIKPIHGVLYFFAIEKCNRLGWKKKFGIPSSEAMEAIGVKSRNTYLKALNDLVDWGFIEMIEVSKNQWSSNIIAISKIDTAQYTALDTATIQQSIRHVYSTMSGSDTINKPITNNHKPINQEEEEDHSPPPEKKYKPSKEEIETIYKFYPRKVGKGKAIKAIEKSLLKLRDSGEMDPYSWLLHKVQEYAESDEGKGLTWKGTQPHPSTWFNEDRYLDNPAEWKSKKQQNGTYNNTNGARHSAFFKRHENN